MMKKYFTVLVCTSLLMSCMTGCGKNDDESTVPTTSTKADVSSKVSGDSNSAGNHPAENAPETTVEYKVAEDFAWTLEAGVLTISGNGLMPDWDNPHWLNGEPAPWSENREEIKKVVIENGIMSIGDNAFYECYSLTKITIPDSVTRIGEYAFFDNTSLTAITLPESVTSIGERAFSSCTVLPTITIPAGVTSIGEAAFYDCRRFTEITIPVSVTSIGEAVFGSCDSLAEILVDEENACYTSEDGVLFNKEKTILYAYPAEKLGENYIIPDSVTKIGERAFYNCNLIEITIPNGVTSIGDYAFSDCDYLTAITIPDGVTSIGSFVFDYCYSLTEITIPDSVTSIGEYAFHYCNGLTTIIIPDSVTSIGKGAFSWCSDLTDVYYSGTGEEWGKIVFDSENEWLFGATIHYDGSVQTGGLEID